MVFNIVQEKNHLVGQDFKNSKVLKKFSSIHSIDNLYSIGSFHNVLVKY